jgi:hypothetical protein
MLHSPSINHSARFQIICLVHFPSVGRRALKRTRSHKRGKAKNGAASNRDYLSDSSFISGFGNIGVIELEAQRRFPAAVKAGVNTKPSRSASKASHRRASRRNRRSGKNSGQARDEFFRLFSHPRSLAVWDILPFVFIFIELIERIS